MCKDCKKKAEICVTNNLTSAKLSHNFRNMYLTKQYVQNNLTFAEMGDENYWKILF